MYIQPHTPSPPCPRATATGPFGAPQVPIPLEAGCIYLHSSWAARLLFFLSSSLPLVPRTREVKLHCLSPCDWLWPDGGRNFSEATPQGQRFFFGCFWNCWPTYRKACFFSLFFSLTRGNGSGGICIPPTWSAGEVRTIWD